MEPQSFPCASRVATWFAFQNIKRELGDAAVLRRQIGDHVDEMAGIKGFRHMDLKAGGENGVTINRRRVRRQRDSRYEPPALAVTSADPTDQSVTVVIGHPDIGHENVGP